MLTNDDIQLNKTVPCRQCRLKTSSTADNVDSSQCQSKCHVCWKAT